MTDLKHIDFIDRSKLGSAELGSGVKCSLRHGLSLCKKLHVGCDAVYCHYLDDCGQVVNTVSIRRETPVFDFR